jgi:hypothetical protein
VLCVSAAAAINPMTSSARKTLSSCFRISLSPHGLALRLAPVIFRSEFVAPDWIHVVCFSGA